MYLFLKIKTKTIVPTYNFHNLTQNKAILSYSMKAYAIRWLIKKLLLIDVFRSIPEDDIISKQRFNLFRIFTLVATLGIAAITYQAYVVFHVKGIMSLVLIVLLGVICLNYLLLNVHRNRSGAAIVSILSCFLALHYVSYFAGGIRNSGMFYLIAFILVAFMMLGSKTGKWVTLLCVSNLIYFYFITEYTTWVNYDFIGYSSTLINQDYLFTGIISLIVIGSLINNLESNKNVVISTITDSRNKLALINKELQKLSLVASKTDNAVAITNANGITEWVNDGFGRLTGFRYDEVAGNNMLEMLYGPLTDKNTIRNIFNELKEQKSCSVELLKYRKDGSTTWMHDNITPIVDDTGKVSKFIYIMSDINERKRAEIKLEEYLRDLEKTNQELDKFAYVVSHDLKAPLRAIGNLTDWILEDSGDALKGQSAENFQLIKGRVKRMELLINAILDYSKAAKRKNPEELFSFKELLNETVDLVSPASNCKISIAGNMPDYFGDRIKYQQIFINLLSNAVKHNDKPFIEISVSCFDADKFWKFSITDNGPGIDARYHEKVFVIFQTLKARDEFESTGIGLAIVKKIVEESGGKIWLESSFGHGSTFHFTVLKNTLDPALITGNPSTLKQILL